MTLTPLTGQSSDGGELHRCGLGRGRSDPGRERLGEGSGGERPAGHGLIMDSLDSGWERSFHGCFTAI